MNETATGAQSVGAAGGHPRGLARIGCGATRKLLADSASAAAALLLAWSDATETTIVLFKTAGRGYIQLRLALQGRPSASATECSGSS